MADRISDDALKGAALDTAAADEAEKFTEETEGESAAVAGETVTGETAEAAGETGEAGTGETAEETGEAGTGETAGEAGETVTGETAEAAGETEAEPGEKKTAEEEPVCWYILHTYSGYETMVEQSLHRLVENNNLQDQIFDVKILMEDTLEERNGKKKIVPHKRMPCYVFIKMRYSNQLWYMVTNTRGVTGFVGPMGRPSPLSDMEIRRMRLEDTEVETDFMKGEEVSIISGPLEGFDGVIKELKPVQQKAIVNIMMFDRSTDAEVEYAQITKKIE